MTYVAAFKKASKKEFEQVPFTLSDRSILVDLYYRGKLGPYPKSVDRLRAGLSLMKDYYYATRTQSLTCRYDGLPRSGCTSSGDAYGIAAQDARDRYMGAIKAVGKYKAYAVHFLLDEKNVNQFLSENPILDGKRLCSYRAIYKAVNDMLDLLVSYYQSI